MLSENLKRKRVAKGLSQEELAKQLSVVRQTVSKWEKGLSVPDSDMLLKIAESLDTTVSSLLDEKVSKKSDVTSENEKKTRRIGALEIVLLVLGSPVWISVLIAAFSVVISLYAALWSLVITIWSVFVVLAGCGFGFTVGGVIIAITGNTASGTQLFGGGLLTVGLSIFVFFGATAATKGAARFSKLPFIFIKKSSKRGGSDE